MLHKVLQNRNANNHTWDSKDSTANKDGDNDQKTGKSCGITKNLRSKNIAVKLLENKNKNCKINSPAADHQQDEKNTWIAPRWVKKWNYVGYTNDHHTDQKYIWHIQKFIPI